MNKAGAMFGLCVGVGLAVGVALHQVAVWLPIGIVVGIILDRQYVRKGRPSL